MAREPTLVLANRVARLRVPSGEDLSGGKAWAALCAATEMVGKFDKSLILEAQRGIEPLYRRFADGRVTSSPLRRIILTYRFNYYSDTKYHSQRDDRSSNKSIVPKRLFFAVSNSFRHISLIILAKTGSN